MDGNTTEKNKGKAETTMEDKLGALPDEILQHILSFLETKQAVQTSILSQRWRYLWTTLPIININSESFRYYSTFANFVVGVLARREESSVNFCKFWFDISNPIYSSIQMCIDSHDLFEPLVKRVIDHVVIHGIKILSLHFPRIVDDLNLLFNCQSLIALELRELVFLPISLDFATLTTLNLSKCSFVLSGDDSFDPFKGCLNLKNLVIKDCRIPSRVKTFEISAPELTNLTISTMDHVRNLNSNCKIVLSSANIKSFTFVESHALEFSVADLPFMERVHVDVVVPDYLNGNNLVAKAKVLSRMIDMFRAMGNAEIVLISINTVNVLSKFSDVLCDPSPFPQMKTLKITVAHQPSTITMPVQVMNFLLNGSCAKDFEVECLR